MTPYLLLSTHYHFLILCMLDYYNELILFLGSLHFLLPSKMLFPQSIGRLLNLVSLIFHMASSNGRCFHFIRCSMISLERSSLCQATRKPSSLVSNLSSLSNIGSSMLGVTCCPIFVSNKRQGKHYDS